MDYELGSRKMPWSYCQALEREDNPVLDRNSDTSSFKASFNLETAISVAKNAPCLAVQICILFSNTGK